MKSSSYSRTVIYLCFVVLVAVCAPLAALDRVHMTDGTIREGEIVSESAQTVSIKISSGVIKATIELSKSEIAKIEQGIKVEDPPPTPMEESTSEAAPVTSSAKIWTGTMPDGTPLIQLDYQRIFAGNLFVQSIRRRNKDLTTTATLTYLRIPVLLLDPGDGSYKINSSSCRLVGGSFQGIERFPTNIPGVQIQDTGVLDSLEVGSETSGGPAMITFRSKVREDIRRNNPRTPTNRGLRDATIPGPDPGRRLTRNVNRSRRPQREVLRTKKLSVPLIESVTLIYRVPLRTSRFEFRIYQSKPQVFDLDMIEAVRSGGFGQTTSQFSPGFAPPGLPPGRSHPKDQSKAITFNQLTSLNAADFPQDIAFQIRCLGQAARSVREPSGREKVVNFLKQCASHEESQVRTSAVEGLASIMTGRDPYAGWHETDVLKELHAALDDDSFQVRLAAVSGFLNPRVPIPADESLYEKIAANVSDEDRVGTARTALALVSMKNYLAVRALAKAPASTETKQWIIQLVTEESRDRTAQMGLFIAFMDDEDAEVRRQSANALTTLGGEARQALAIRGLADPEPSIQQLTLEYLVAEEGYRPNSASDPIFKLISTNDAEQALQALLIISRNDIQNLARTVEFSEHILAALVHANPQVRQASLAVVSRYGQVPSLLPLFGTCVGDDDKGVAYAATSALVSSDQPEAQSILFDALDAMGPADWSCLVDILDDPAVAESAAQVKVKRSEHPVFQANRPQGRPNFGPGFPPGAGVPGPGAFPPGPGGFPPGPQGGFPGPGSFPGSFPGGGPGFAGPSQLIRSNLSNTPRKRSLTHALLGLLAASQRPKLVEFALSALNERSQNDNAKTEAIAVLREEVGPDVLLTATNTNDNETLRKTAAIALCLTFGFDQQAVEHLVQVTENDEKVMMFNGLRAAALRDQLESEDFITHRGAVDELTQQTWREGLADLAAKGTPEQHDTVKTIIRTIYPLATESDISSFASPGDPASKRNLLSTMESNAHQQSAGDFRMIAHYRAQIPSFEIKREFQPNGTAVGIVEGLKWDIQEEIVSLGDGNANLTIAQEQPHWIFKLGSTPLTGGSSHNWDGGAWPIVRTLPPRKDILTRLLRDSNPNSLRIRLQYQPNGEWMGDVQLQQPAAYVLQPLQYNSLNQLVGGQEPRAQWQFIRFYLERIESE